MPDSPSTGLAARVRAEMAARKLSGRRLSTEMDWHYPHLARRLSGDVPFRADELARIAAHIGVPIEQFFGPPASEPAPLDSEAAAS